MKKGGKIAITVSSIVVGVLLIGSLGLYLGVRANFSPASQKGDKTEDGIVETDKGKLQGRINNGVYNFLGIEYAEANKRFQRAEEVPFWSGVKEATQYGPASKQASYIQTFVPAEYSENPCNLNLWTPSLTGKKPVMVWLHGGGFSSGSAYFSKDYQGENLSKNQDVVVINVNHRLNLLGHFDLSKYGEEYKYSANIGIFDIIDALNWIQRNVERFGGDKNNVTLFGQSGGGAKILALMTSPYAKGLFQKAIIQSGATETVGVHFTSKEVSQSLTERMLDELKIDRSDIHQIDAVSYSDLAKAGDDALQKTANEYKIPGPFGGYQMEWEPVVEGDFLESDPVVDGNFNSNGNGIPLLIGSTLNEWTRSRKFYTLTDAIRDEFKKAYPDIEEEQAGYVDSLIRIPMLKIRDAKAKDKTSSVYSYIFAYGEKTPHTAEIPYVFDNAKDPFADTVSSLWANFARSGVPSADEVPTWENYTQGNGATMILEQNSHIAYHHDRELLKLIDPDDDYVKSL